jgi:phosphoribosyl-AMP cyclohydrolase / phosphoribosyl-ATP pyrophosphohydrolase
VTNFLDLNTLNFAQGDGSVTVVAQDARTGVVLMVAGADREALEKTMQTGEMHYRSRTRGLWHKGATSGNTQRVVSLAFDCDADAVLARVIPAGPACHNGSTSCFGTDALEGSTLSALDTLIAERAGMTATATSASYTARLLGDRNLRLKKIGEESAEFVVALADGDVDRATNEAADLFYHTLVALRAIGVGFDAVCDVLAARSRPAVAASDDGPHTRAV